MNFKLEMLCNFGSEAEEMCVEGFDEADCEPKTVQAAHDVCLSCLPPPVFGFHHRIDASLWSARLRILFCRLLNVKYTVLWQD